MNNETIALITDHLNKTNSKWGIGGSRLLFQHGLIDVVNDLDIIVHRDDMETVMNELRMLGNERTVQPRDPYQTTYYYKFNIMDLSMDVMGEFQIQHDKGVYVFPFENHSVDYFIINGVEVPFCTLEDWYILYQLIPGREEKMRIIENFFIENGVEHPEILQQSLLSSLPEDVRLRVQQILTHIGYAHK